MKSLKKIIAISILIILILALFIGTLNTAIAQEKPLAYFGEEIQDYGSDTDDNELFNFLIVKTTIIVREPGVYEFGGKLSIHEDYPVIYVYQYLELDLEANEAALKFSGELISKSYTKGPYKLELWVADEDGKIYDEVIHKTSEYDYLSFEHPPSPASLTGKIEDYGSDMDEDARFDFLTLEVELEVLESGTYYFGAGLFQEQVREKEQTAHKFYYRISWAQRVLDLDEGLQFVKLNFNGPDIYISKLNGPYWVGFWLEKLEDQPKQPEEPEKPPHESYYRLEEENMAFPCVGKGDLSGNLTYQTSEYNHTSFEEPIVPAKFTERILDYGTDLNNNRRYEFLTIEVNLDVTVAGEYLIVGELRREEHWAVLYTENVTHLREGTHSVLLNFRGFELYKSKLDGPYSIGLIVKYIQDLERYDPEGNGSGERQFEWYAPDKQVYQTSKYSHLDFEDKPLELIDDDFRPIDDEWKYRPVAETGDQLITIKTDVIEVYVSKSRPDLRFWYNPAEDGDIATTTERLKSDANFKLIFNRIIGFNDHNSNHIYNRGEELYAGELSESVWHISEITYGETKEFGNYIEFQMSSRIDLIRTEPELRLEDKEPERDPERLAATRTIFNWATVTFKFLIATNDFQTSGPETYKIEGGVELKIDIDLEIYNPIEVNALCIEHLIYDDSQLHRFKTYEADGPHVYDKNGYDFDERQFLELSEDKQRIGFIDDQDLEHGYYSWVPYANLTYSSGKTVYEEVKASYETDGSLMRLYICYPYTERLTTISHDPSIGVIEEANPYKSEADKDVLEQILFNPFTYAIACVAVVVAVYFIRKVQKD